MLNYNMFQGWQLPQMQMPQVRPDPTARNNATAALNAPVPQQPAPSFGPPGGVAQPSPYGNLLSAFQKPTQAPPMQNAAVAGPAGTTTQIPILASQFQPQMAQLPGQGLMGWLGNLFRGS